jgi:hypothetical protein
VDIRLRAYYLDNKYDENKMIHRLARKLFNIINKYFPLKLEYDFYAGLQWTNYTHNCVKNIIRYLWTSCADEIFFQTIIAKLDGLKTENNPLRYIDWKNSRPKILREKVMKK